VVALDARLEALTSAYGLPTGPAYCAVPVALVSVAPEVSPSSAIETGPGIAFVSGVRHRNGLRVGSAAVMERTLGKGNRLNPGRRRREQNGGAGAVSRPDLRL
jgi:hypothetical protein